VEYLSKFKSLFKTYSGTFGEITLDKKSHAAVPSLHQIITLDGQQSAGVTGQCSAA
jgi:hypothetical protein